MRMEEGGKDEPRSAEVARSHGVVARSHGVVEWSNVRSRGVVARSHGQTVKFCPEAFDHLIVANTGPNTGSNRPPRPIPSGGSFGRPGLA